MPTSSRREFLQDAILAAAAGLSSANCRSVRADADQFSTGPNEKLGVAVIGLRSRGVAHCDAFAARPDAEILWLVDVDASIAHARAIEVAKRQRRTPRVAQDLRQALSDPAVDVVSIATPNHWHALAAIWAMEHGKDVYVEKPVSHNVSEGRRMVEVARKYNRICQTGTQSRSMTAIREAIKYLHDGNLGEVKLARGLCYKPRPSIGPRGKYPGPAEVDYNLWLGPASMSPVTRPQFHYDWHWQWAYGNGDLGNQGVHEMDVARWGLGVSQLSNRVLSYGGRFGYDDAGETANTQVVIHDYGDKTLIFEVRGLKTASLKNARIGVIFECSDGYLVVSNYAASAFDRDEKLIRQFTGGHQHDHFSNFVAAVRSRRADDLNADILEGHISSALCHIGNIAYRLGTQVSVPEARRELESLAAHYDAVETLERTIQHLEDNDVDLNRTHLQLGPWLAIDPQHEKFLDNALADEMLSRQYREPFVVPGADPA